MRINRQVCGLTALACLAMTSFSCGGEGGEEAVFLYFINGYPGTGAMSINNNAGSLVSNVPFGERHGDSGSCGPDDTSCPPLRVERQRGTEFTFILENMVERVDVQKDLYAMYPHETGTVVLTRRNDEASIETTLLRHTQSISSDCTISFVNGLSLSNEFVGSFASYSITPELFETNIAQAGFVEESQFPFISECGALPTDDPTHANLQRPEVIAAIEENPWFLLECDADDGCRLRWGIPNEDGRVRIMQGGSFPSVLDSREYFECVQAGISLRQEEDTMAMPGFPPPEPDCPTQPITWADVDVDAQVLEQCKQPVARSATMQDPGQEDTVQSYQGSLVCDMTFRIRNEGPDIIFGPRGNDDLGSHGRGAPIESEVQIPDGSQRFWVLLGRPVNPIVWQWDSSETFVDLGDFPYFNEGGDRPVVGDNDR